MAAQSTAASARRSSQSQSPFFRLPPELRNYIYDDVFTSSLPAEGSQVDLLTATAPCKALALTCKRTREDSSLLYRSTYRRFWSQTCFSLVLDYKFAVFGTDSKEFFNLSAGERQQMLDARASELAADVKQKVKADWDFVRNVKVVKIKASGLEVGRLLPEQGIWERRTIGAGSWVGGVPSYAAFVRATGEGKGEVDANEFLTADEAVDATKTLPGVPVREQIAWLASAVPGA